MSEAPNPSAGDAPTSGEAGAEGGDAPGLSRGGLAYLLVTAVMCGGLIMVIEVLGSRVVGPLYGVSLFVWTSLITVTMLALAAGYALGGRLSDRYSSPDVLYGLILAAGVITQLIPFVKAPILKACLPLGLRGGAFMSTLILFGVPLLLLGCVSPYLVRLAVSQMSRIGRTVGTFYALSTVGSVAGTVLTGFFLVGHVGVDATFHLAGCFLMALALVHFVLLRRRYHLVAACVVPLLFLPPEPPRVARLANGTEVEVVDARDGFYGSLKVIDYVKPGGGLRVRELAIDGLIQGGVDVADGRSVYAYSYFLSLIPRAMLPEGRNCLVIGLGAGILPVWYTRRGVKTDVVDIDPDVVTLAREHFGFSTSGEVFIDDARHFLATGQERYDYVLLAVFSGDTTPGHLLSREALELTAARLSDRGVLGINLIGSLERETLMTASVVRSLEALFEQVEIYPTFGADEPEQFGNLAIIAYRGPPRSFSPTEALAVANVHPLARKSVGRNLGRRFRFPAGTPAIELTDDYNPIDVYDAWLREDVRQAIVDGTDWDLLIASE
jgi:spermidine synthase